MFAISVAMTPWGEIVIRIIASRTSRPFPLVVTKDRERVEVQNRRGLTSNDIMACLTMSLAGLGVVHALAFSATTHLRSGALEAVLNDWVTDPFPFSSRISQTGT